MNARSMIFIVLLAALAVTGCGITSSVVESGKGASAAKIAPYQSWWNYNMWTLNQSVPLADNGFVVLRRAEKDRYVLERYNHDLAVTWSTPVELEDDETSPQLFRQGDRLYVFFQREAPDDRWQSVGRRFDLATGKLTDKKVMLQIKEEPDQALEYRFSPDSSRIAIIARGKIRSDRDADGNPVGTTPLYTGVVDRDLQPVQERSIDLHDAVIDNRYYYNDVQVTNAGEADVMYIYFSEGKYRTGLRRYAPGVEAATVTFDDPLPELKLGIQETIPSQLSTIRLPDNSIVGITRLRKGNETHGLLWMRWNPETKQHQVKELLAVTEEVANKLVGDNDMEDVGLRNLLLTPQGDVVILMEESSYTYPLTGQTRYSSGPIVVVTADANGAVKSMAKIERNEAGSPAEINYFEGNLAGYINHSTLYVATRQRQLDGVTLHAVDLATGTVSPPRTIVGLGNMAYFGADYTTWLPNGEIVVWGKEGQGGDDWKMVRVTP